MDSRKISQLSLRRAAQKFLGRPAEELAWTTKIDKPGVMDLIRPPDVTRKLDEVLRYMGAERPRMERANSVNPSGALGN